MVQPLRLTDSKLPIAGAQTSYNKRRDWKPRIGQPHYTPRRPQTALQDYWMMTLTHCKSRQAQTGNSTVSDKASHDKHRRVTAPSVTRQVATSTDG